jgi:hypothetical protein
VQRAGRCARFGGDGRVAVFTADPAPYEPPFLEITRDYLHHHPYLQLSDWQATTAFVDRLPYYVNDLLANDSLNDLYEATLFADTRPHRLSVREGKPLYLWVKGENEAPDSASIRDQLIAIDIRQAARVRSLIQDAKGKCIRLVRDDAAGLREEPTTMLLPFVTYVLPRTKYSPELGVVWP